MTIGWQPLLLCISWDIILTGNPVIDDDDDDGDDDAKRSACPCPTLPVGQSVKGQDPICNVSPD